MNGTTNEAAMSFRINKGERTSLLRIGDAPKGPKGDRERDCSGDPFQGGLLLSNRGRTADLKNRPCATLAGRVYHQSHDAL
jgi:hypothetical protein